MPGAGGRRKYLASYKILVPTILLLMVPATAYVTTATAHPTSCSAGLHSIHIQASGTATSIPPPANLTAPASIDLTGTIKDKKSPNLIAYTIDSGTLVIGGTTYTVVMGWGIFVQPSLLVEVHSFVMIGNQTLMLILHGHADNSLCGPGTVHVTFTMPESKLASKWFLQLSDTLTLS
jgi:hypothetical protein